MAGRRKRRSGGDPLGGLVSKVIMALIVLSVIATGWRVIPGEGDNIMETLEKKNENLKSWYENKNLDGIRLDKIKLPGIELPSIGDGSGSSDGGKGKPSMSKSEAEKTLKTIKTASPKKVAYNRDEWKHWDNVTSCWTVREQVLADEAEKGSLVLLDSKGKKTSSVKNACKIESGKWKEPYSGKTVTNPSKLDIDHMIPLSYTAKQGGQAWSKDKKREYANNLKFENHLVAVDASANREKSDQGPSTWKPKNKNYHCTYATSWVTIAKNYNLSLPESDKSALRSMLKTCG